MAFASIRVAVGAGRNTLCAVALKVSGHVVLGHYTFACWNTI